MSNSKSYKPIRIQRKRTKGWAAPAGAVYVGRPTKWGNPHSVKVLGRSLAVQLFRGDAAISEAFCEQVRRELCGKDLMCWCPLDCECHADVLLEIAAG